MLINNKEFMNTCLLSAVWGDGGLDYSYSICTILPVLPTVVHPLHELFKSSLQVKKYSQL